MVTFYNGIEDVPDGSFAVEDNEKFFSAVTIHKLDADVNRLLKHTDQCTYHDEYGFNDRFGWTLPWQCLSTGGKTVLNAYYNPDKVFNGIECGNNAAADAAQLPHGSFYNLFPWAYDDNTPMDVVVDGIRCHTFKEAVDNG